MRVGWASGTGLAAYCPYAATSCGNLWGIVTAVPSGGKIAVIRAGLRTEGELRVMPGTAVERRRRRCGGRQICVDKRLVRWCVAAAQTLAAGCREDVTQDTSSASGGRAFDLGDELLIPAGKN